MHKAGKVFIHVGPPKTGTSAVQHVMRTHDNSQVLYPKVGLWADGSHHNLAFNFYQDFQRPEAVRSDIVAMFALIGVRVRSSAHAPREARRLR
jgi:hypothetical protein